MIHLAWSEWLFCLAPRDAVNHSTESPNCERLFRQAPRDAVNYSTGCIWGQSNCNWGKCFTNRDDNAQPTKITLGEINQWMFNSRTSPGWLVYSVKHRSQDPPNVWPSYKVNHSHESPKGVGDGHMCNEDDHVDKNNTRLNHSMNV